MNYMFEVIGLALFFTSLLFVIIILVFEYAGKKWMKKISKEQMMKITMEIKNKKPLEVSLPENSSIWEVTDAMQELLIKAGFTKNLIQGSFTLHPSKLYGEDICIES